MKPCNNMNNHQNAKPKILLRGVLVICLALFLASFTPALGQYEGWDEGSMGISGGDKVQVEAQSTTKATAALKKKTTIDKIKDWFREDAWKELKKSGAIAYKAAIKNFLNSLAYDMASYLATGDKGQAPMFQTQGWGGYLQNAADNAAGTFIEAFGREGLGGVKFNLCNPNFDVLLRINLGLVQSVRPRKPVCTFSQMTKNWDNALRDKDFLPKFQDMFNPWSNDLGIALTVQTGMESAISKKVNSDIKDREEGEGFKAVTDSISGYIKTPAKSVLNASNVTFEKSADNVFVYTGEVVADSVDIFINTLMGKLIQKWLTQGLSTKMPSLTNKLDSLTNPNAQNQSEGAAGAKDRMKTIVEPNFKVRADYDILAELVVCPDPNKAGPTDCVIDEKFRQAIEKKLTVGQALEQGYLNGNGIFGFTSDGLEPKFNEGYPYRSMLILRKYRIIPVGWEVAAQYIKDCQNNTDQVKCGGKKVDGTKNLSDLTACFKNGDPWCQDLVDPDWVLKAPQNFCKREGAGSQIISEQVTGQEADSALAVLRNDTYCADEQSCIKEKADGSCQLYGYCTEERRKWDFNASSCEPLYNTCRTFSSPTGQTVSYLENSLDFGVCDATSAGCLAYCQDYDLATDEFTCTNNSDDKINLNKQTETCDTTSEGCRALIRTKDGLGANLLVNGGFEEGADGWSLSPAADFSIDTSEFQSGGQSLKISRSALADYSFAQKFVSGIEPEERITVSYYVKTNLITSGPHYGAWLVIYPRSGNDGTGRIVVDSASNRSWMQESVLTETYPGVTDWHKISFSFVTPPATRSLVVEPRIQGQPGTAYFDSIKVERGAAATDFSEYASGYSLIYEKLLPDYLADGADHIQGACYERSPDGFYGLKSGAPAECLSYARRCTAVEAGCELYTGVNRQAEIPAKAASNDYCPVECVGYNTFIQSETFFDSSRDAYFIPKTAKSCSAESQGCDQFTNLDEVAKGGEGVEYYTYLKQCIKPDATCAEFYSWEGSDESGYQLKVESLKASGIGLNQEPVLTDGSGSCEDIYNLPPSDPAYNPDCRQFYNRAGGISYHLSSRTISCTEDCHPYRRTERNIVPDISDKGDCIDLDGQWDEAGGQCIICKGGGVWSPANNACLYMAVPGQGITCSAAQNGCREYVGNIGNNVRDIFTDDFSAGVGAWFRDAGVNGSNIAPSSESITLDADNKGHSLEVTNAAIRPVGKAVNQGLDYVINFVAKAAVGNSTLTFSLSNGTDTMNFSTASLTTDWQIFEVSLSGLNHEPSTDEILRLTTTGSIYIDSLTLTEITDRYYLLKNSWQTPASCDEDLEGDPAPLYMLGCDQYKDRDNKTHNLKKFSQLCSESAVGCELMIDTRNSGAPEASYYLDGNIMPTGSTCAPGPASDCVVVPADDLIYVVYDPEKLCGADEKGCQRLGKPYLYENTALYGDVYLKNDPDQYGQILCGEDEIGCEIFAYDQGEKYFKDPGDQVCEYRQQKFGEGVSYDWYKKKVKRCDDGLGSGEINGKIDASGDPLAPAETNICLSDADCPIITGAKHYSCITDNNDYKCPASDLKTLGPGGVGGRIVQPDKDNRGTPAAQDDVKWAGLCSAENSGCSEYLDPVSGFNNNLIFNGSFQVLASAPSDGWKGIGPSSGPPYSQSVTLEPNTVYRLGRLEKDGRTPGYLSIDCPPVAAPDGLYGITSDNTLIGPVSATSTDANYKNSKIFYYKADAPANCEVRAENTNGAVELKRVAIDYQLAQNLDTKTCNGAVNTGQGCVLFNERKQSGSGLAALTWDADTGNISGSVADADKDSNIIIKVAPDRVCDKWLACKSYIKDAKGNNVCFDVGLCDAVDANGNCQSFVPSPKENQTVGPGAAWISNLSGYSKVGIVNGSLRTDYYPFGAMEQKGEVADFANGGFEYYGSNLYPIGWNWGNPAGASWSANIFSAVNNPIAAQSEGVGYAKEGKAFLKLGSSYAAVSEQIDVIRDTDYIITAYLNTKNLKSGEARIDEARIDIVDKDYEDGRSAIAGAGGIIKQSIGNDWNFQMGKFNTGANSQVKIKLYSSAGGAAGSEGNFYYDDIKIRPALESKCLEADGDCKTSPYKAWYTPQSCRLYPQSDSLACDYYEESGIRQKGWLGYCLEYDRRPGDPGTCLLWYPIDKVKGDGIEEGAGYSDRVPLYYTIESERQYNCSTDILVGVKKGEEYRTPAMSCHSFNDECDYGRYTLFFSNGQSTAYNFSNYGYAVSCSKGGITATYNGLSSRIFTDSEYDWYCPDNFYPELIRIDGACGADLTIDPGPRRKFGQFIAKKIVQVVTPMGSNKYWSSRVYKGSDYHYTCNAGAPDHILTSLIPSSPGYALAVAGARDCDYGSDFSPFGSVVPPTPSSNPYDWDSGEQEAGIQPLYYTLDENAARIGQIQTIDRVKRLFAQSYGVWEWDQASLATASCSGGSRQGQSCELSRNDCPGGSCGPLTAAVNVCSGDNNINCAICGAGELCEIGATQQSRCGGLASGDGCCMGAAAAGVTSCSGLSCDLANGDYRCGGTGALCCPSGTACFVCGDKTIISGVPDANCGASGLTCESTAVVNDFYSCGGVDDYSMRCCQGGEGVCREENIEVCSGGSDNDGGLCPNDHFCDGGECVSQTILSGVKRYVKDTTAPDLNWGPPDAVCPGTGRPDYPNDYCAIRPVVSSIKVNSMESDNVILTKNGFINLTFNTRVDSNQLPMVMYGIDWGDDTETTVTGVEMRDKPNPDNPESVYHLYSYWDLKAKFNQGLLPFGSSCNTDASGTNYCRIQPGVQIKDNWGWCNGSIAINNCNNNYNWQRFLGEIIVEEK